MLCRYHYILFTNCSNFSGSNLCMLGTQIAPRESNLCMEHFVALQTHWGLCMMCILKIEIICSLQVRKNAVTFLFLDRFPKSFRHVPRITKLYFHVYKQWNDFLYFCRLLIATDLRSVAIKSRQTYRKTL